MTYGETIVLKCSTCSGLINEEIINSGNSIGAIYWTDGQMDAPMLPESYQLIKCPHCQALLWKEHQEKLGTLSSLSVNKKNNSMDYEVPSFDDYYTYLDTNRQFINNKVVDINEQRYFRYESWFYKTKQSVYMNNYDRRYGITDGQRGMLNIMFSELTKAGDTDYLSLAGIKMQLGEIDVVKILLDKVDLDIELEGEDRLNADDFKSLHFKLWHIGNDKRRRSNNKPELSEEEKINLTTLYSILDKSNESDYLFMAEIKRELGDFENAEAILNNSEFSDFEHYVSTMKVLIKEENPFVAQVK